MEKVTEQQKDASNLNSQLGRDEDEDYPVHMGCVHVRVQNLGFEKNLGF